MDHAGCLVESFPRLVLALKTEGQTAGLMDC